MVMSVAFISTLGSPLGLAFAPGGRLSAVRSPWVLLGAVLLLSGWPALAQLQLAWSRTFTGQIADLSMHQETNACLAGTLEGDFQITCYGPNGAVVWSRRYDGGATETAHAMVADAAGQVWVTGSSVAITNGIASSLAVVTLKYGPDGILIWSRRLEAGAVFGSVMKVDGAGNSYVAGSRQVSTNRWALFLLKYTMDGGLAWRREHELGSNWYVGLGGLALDPAGGAVVVGFGTEVGTFARQNLVLKFNPDGALQWRDDTLPYEGGGTPGSVTIDRGGQVYVLGNGRLAACFGPDGELRWEKVRDGAERGYIFTSSAVDPAGNLVLAGTDVMSVKLCTDCGDRHNIYSLHSTKLDRDGQTLTAERSYTDYGFGQWQFDPDGSAYLGGTFSSYSDDPLPPHADSILVKYAPNGAELWRTNFSTGRLADFAVNATGDLYLAVGDFSGSRVQKYSQPPSLPVIRSQPQPLTILDGDDARFTVAASGFPSPTFQWRLDGVDLAGQTNATLLLAGARRSQMGVYSVLLQNSVGSALSIGAALGVAYQAPSVAPTFTLGASSVLWGTPVTICAGAVGGPKPNLQWRFNGVDLPGETNSCLVLGPARTDQNGAYEVIASNEIGTARATVGLEVRALEIAFALGASLVTNAYDAYVGQYVELTSTVALPPPFSRQWLRDGAEVAGATDRELVFYPVETNHAGRYSLVLSHASGVYTSAPVDLRVYIAAPANAYLLFELGRQLSSSLAAMVGDDVMLSAAYFGSPAAIQWRLNGVDLPGETNRTLVLFSVTTNQAGDYSFTATNSAGSTASSAGTLTVNYGPPTFLSLPSQLSVEEGGTARFSIFGRGGPTPSYFLEHNGTNVAVPFAYGFCCGEGLFDLLDVTVADAGSYRFIASNSIASVTSAVVNLTVSRARPLGRWTQRNPLPQSHALLALAHGADQFVAVGVSGTILNSPDGVNWAVPSRRTDFSLRAIAYGNGAFVAVGDGGTVLSSSDGTNWVYRYSAAATSLSSVTYGAGRFAAFGAGLGGWTVILHSTNGLAWERVVMNGFTATNGVAYGRGHFVAGGADGIVFSTNLTDWVSAAAFRGGVESVVFTGDRFVVVGDDGLVGVSDDGETWSIRGPSTSRRLLDVASGDGRFVAVGARGVILASLDASGWTPVISGTPDRLETIVYAEGTFVAAGENGVILTSTNGINWWQRNFGVTRDLDGLEAAGGGLVVVGKGGTILTSTNGADYRAAESGITNDLHGVAQGDGLWVAVGEPGIILTSSNRVDWTVRDSGNTNSLKDVTFADGQWIAVGTQGTVARSDDGVNWSSTYTSPPFDLNAVAYGDGRFLIAGDGPGNQNGSLFRSPDGITWKPSPEVFGKNLRGIAFASGTFLIAANDGRVFKTVDGVNFNGGRVAAPLSENLRNATWAHGQWIAVGNDGVVATSWDGLSWDERRLRTSENLHRVVVFDGRAIAIGNRGEIFQSDRFLTELDPPVLSPGAGVTVPFRGIRHQIYEVQTSTNLVEWRYVSSLTNRAERGEFTDPSPRERNGGFYRLVEVDEEE